MLSTINTVLWILAALMLGRYLSGLIYQNGFRKGVHLTHIYYQKPRNAKIDFREVEKIIVAWEVDIRRRLLEQNITDERLQEIKESPYKIEKLN